MTVYKCTLKVLFSSLCHSIYANTELYMYIYRSVLDSRIHPPLETTNGIVTGSEEISNALETSTSQPRRISQSDHDYSDIEDMPSPPVNKPQTSHITIRIESTDETDQPDYDHLEPSSDPDEADATMESHYNALEDSVEVKNSEERFQSSQSKLGGSYETSSLKYSKVFRPGMHALSLQDLFDDPKYAMLFVATTRGDRMGALQNGKRIRRPHDLYRSTQSLCASAGSSLHGPPVNSKMAVSQSTDELHRKRKIAVAVDINDSL